MLALGSPYCRLFPGCGNHRGRVWLGPIRVLLDGNDASIFKLHAFVCQPGDAAVVRYHYDSAALMRQLG